jgi:H/ACA ribonucleoprotein complex non-core subunit NAF1
LDRRQHPYRRNSIVRGRGQRGGARGRGRGRGRDRERSAQRNSFDSSSIRYAEYQHDEPYDPRLPQRISTTTPTTVTTSGEYSAGSIATPSPTTAQYPMSPASWSFPHQYHYDLDFNSVGYQQSYVQPHINPRFASAFGIDVGYLQQTHMMAPAYGQSTHEGLDTDRRPSQENWLEEWTVNKSHQDASRPPT